MFSPLSGVNELSGRGTYPGPLNALKTGSYDGLAFSTGLQGSTLDPKSAFQALKNVALQSGKGSIPVLDRYGIEQLSCAPDGQASGAEKKWYGLLRYSTAICNEAGGVFCLFTSDNPAPPPVKITRHSPGAAPSARSGRGKHPVPFWTSMEVSGTNPAPVDLLAGASAAPPSVPILAELVRVATGREQIGRKFGGRSGSLTFATRE